MDEGKEPRSPSNREPLIAPTIMEILERLALVRTEYSSERALMSWMRTSVSLFTFGFSIIKFFDYLEQQQAGAQFSEGPRRLGLALICAGILSLLPAAIEHIRRVRRMKELGLPTFSKIPLPVSATVALLVIGFTAFIGIVMKW